MDLGNKATCLFRPQSSKLAVYTVPTKSSASNIFLINGFVKILEVDNFFSRIHRRAAYHYIKEDKKGVQHTRQPLSST